MEDNNLKKQTTSNAPLSYKVLIIFPAIWILIQTSIYKMRFAEAMGGAFGILVFPLIITLIVLAIKKIRGLSYENFIRHTFIITVVVFVLAIGGMINSHNDRKSETSQTTQSTNTTSSNAMTRMFYEVGCYLGYGQENILFLIGENIKGSKLQKWLNNISIQPEITRYEDQYFYEFKSKGIALNFNSNDILKAVFFYSEGADSYRQYRDKLPFGLTFLDKRNKIESILGSPESMGGSGIINFWAGYPSKKMSITYNTKNINDLDARIKILIIQ